MQVGRNITFIKLLVRNFLQTTQTLKKVSFFDKDISNNKAKVHFFNKNLLFLCMTMYGHYCNNMMPCHKPYENKFWKQNCSCCLEAWSDVTDCKLQTEQFYSLMEKSPFFPSSSCLYSFELHLHAWRDILAKMANLWIWKADRQEITFRYGNPNLKTYLLKFHIHMAYL